MAEEFRVLRPYEFHCQLISKGKRADGRKSDEFRNLKLEIDAISTANSSSLVKLGNTSLACGCTTRLVKKSEFGDESELINIFIDLPPICSSPTGHRTQHNAQLLTKTLKNILQATKCLNYQCLAHQGDKESFWSIDIEVICLNYDGCLLDASIIAVQAALKSLELSSGKKFHLKNMPVCCSFAMIGDHIICDPSLEEETVAQTALSITVDESPQNDACHIIKLGGKAINIDGLTKCIKLARERATQLHKQQ